MMLEKVQFIEVSTPT